MRVRQWCPCHRAQRWSDACSDELNAARRWSGQSASLVRVPRVGYCRRVNLASRVALIALAPVLAATVLVVTHSGSAQQRVAIADPAYGYLVEGRVLRADGRPAAGVQIERAATGNYTFTESTITDATGAFRFEGHGLGFGPGLTWTVTLRRARCPDVTRTITLQYGPVDGYAGDVAKGVVLRLPACRADRPAVPPRDGHRGGLHRTR